MKTLAFKHSPVASIGVELEFQIVEPVSYDLVSRAKEMVRVIRKTDAQQYIKPEITQSMIEINSSVHQSAIDVYEEFILLRSHLLKCANETGIRLCGGGSHPFQKWSSRKIFPSKRFRHKFNLFRYLTQCSTVFGQHVHIGCANAEDALYLTHALARYVPQFIAINASSPFYQGFDTGYQSSRSNVFSAFPLSGVIPYFANWQEFSNYFFKLQDLGIVETMKDIYWDIRPKPEFGTVEVRVCDTPLTIEKAIITTAFIQTVAHYLMYERRPLTQSPDLYFFYSYNRFQASRYGFDGNFVNPYTLQHQFIVNDILETIEIIHRSTKELKNEQWISALKEAVLKKQNDAIYLRQLYKETDSLPELVRKQCQLWEGQA